MNVNILPMRREHLDEIAGIEAECFSEPWSAAALEEELDLPCAVFLTALDEESGRVAGYVGFHHLADTAYFCNIAVSADFRRMGVGSALMRAVFDYAEKNSVSEITLEVRSSNAGARKFYEGFGFELTGTRPNFYQKPTENAEIYSIYSACSANERDESDK